MKYEYELSDNQFYWALQIFGKKNEMLSNSTSYANGSVFTSSDLWLKESLSFAVT